MSRQVIDIGIEGNDGTGDSIRESFRKSNENFQELYAIFGLGGQISITNLDDVPDTLEANKLLKVNSAGTAIEFIQFDSDSALDELDADTILIDTISIPGKIILTTTFGQLEDDTVAPTLGNHLNSNNFAIGGVAVSDVAADALNALPGNGTSYSIDDLVIDRKYADKRYRASNVPLTIGSEPANADAYTLAVESYNASNNAVVTGHGIKDTQNGIAFVYSAEIDIPSASPALVNGTTYYLRRVNDNELALYPTEDDAINKTNKIIISETTITTGDDHTLVNAYYDATLSGNWLSNEPLPRDSVVRRQGDTMTGALTLHDHPGDLAGQAQGQEQLQAATKYYVDNTGKAAPSALFVTLTGDDSQTSTPAGDEGSSPTYAYRTINAAANQAAELVNYSQEIPGPYLQTLTHTNFTVPATVKSTSGIVTPQAPNTNSQLEDNKQFLLAELLAYTKFAYNDYYNDEHFNEQIFYKNYGNLIDSFRLDINRGENANGLTKRFAQKFYTIIDDRETIKQHLAENTAIVNQLYDIIIESIFPATGLRTKIIASITKKSGQTPAVVTTDTNHGLIDGNLVKFTNVAGMTEINNQYAYIKKTSDTEFELYSDINLTVLFDNSLYTDFVDDNNGEISLRYQKYYEQNTSNPVVNVTLNEPGSGNSLLALKDLVLNIWTNDPEAGQDIYHGQPYALVLVNNGGELDQTADSNVDALPSKLVRGKRSGALGQIRSFSNSAAPAETTFNLDMLLPIEFYEDEEIEVGFLTRQKQVTISIESGIYEEDFPIKIPQNTSVVGDEFRRVLVKPKARVSQSRHTEAYFYRDSTFDGIEIASEGIDLNDQSGNPKGKLGRHYLVRADRPKNTGLAISNTGGYTTASNILLQNKEYLVEESLHFLNTNYPAIIYDAREYRNDFRLLIDGLINDLADGGDSNTLEVQGSYTEVGDTDYNTRFQDSSTQSAVGATINNIYDLSSALLSGTTPTYTDASYTAGSSTVTDIVSPDVSLGTSETGTDSIVEQLIAKIIFAASVDYNGPLRNSELDVFLLNDACTMENITIQEHGGFAITLDPDGQILTRSPYIANCSSISKSTNQKTFAGGVYADAYAGNIPIRIRGNSGVFTDATGSVSLDAFTLWVESVDNDVLGDSTITTEQGLKVRKPQLPSVFYVDGVRYQVNTFSNYDEGLGRAILYLDPQTNSGNGFTTVVGDGIDTFLQMGGSRSITVDNFTQTNDLGYGIVAVNGAKINTTNVNARYNQAAFYSKDGSDIAVLNSNTSFGRFGLVAEGANPNEIPDTVNLSNDMVRPAKVHGTFTAASGVSSIQIYDLAVAPKSGGIISIATQTGDSSITTPLDYRISSVTEEIVTGSPAVIDSTVYTITFSADDASSTNFYGTLQTDLADDQLIEYRDSKQLVFDNVIDPSTLSSKPNTTVNYAESADTTYNLVNFSTNNSVGDPLGANEIQAQFNQDYAFINLVPFTANSRMSGGNGDAIGDTSLAIERITGGTVAYPNTTRIVGMIFAWAGKTHEITTYTETSAGGDLYAIIDFVDYGTDINPSPPANGIAESINENSPATLYAGLKVNTAAEITESTAILRAANSSFNDIGKGSFNEANFPNSILGDPLNTADPTSFTTSPSATNAEVWEKTKGRVFWTSADQFGTFRVGQFFNVDQGTGDTTISGGIGISDATSLGFSLGTTVSEFSTDSGMTDRSDDAVPTEKAIAEYVDQRLGIDEAGALVTEIGPGVMSLGGGGATTTPMKANMSLGGFAIQNMITPGTPAATDAASVGYVDNRVAQFDSLTELNDTAISSEVLSDLLVYNGSAWEDAAVSGDVTLIRSGANVITSAISSGVIVNDDVNASAAIAQSKLDLLDASDSVKGIASFSSAHFTVTSGAVDITANSIEKADIEQIATSTVLGRLTAGTGNVEEVPIANVLSAGNAVLDGDFVTDNTGTKVLTQVAAGSYGLTNLSATTSNNSLVKRSAAGEVDATAYQIDGNQILDVDVTATVLKTSAGGEIFRADGASKPTLETTGAITVGDIAAFSESTFHAASDYGTGQVSEETSGIAARWIYSSFIEAPDEKGASSTGISIGTGTGVANAANDTIVLVTNGVSRATIDNNGLEVVAGSYVKTDTITTGGSATAGTVTGNWTLTTGSRFEATYADIAEYYEADHTYEPGTVLVFGGEKEVTGCTEHRSTRVAGVVSNTAAFTMNQDCPGIATCVALVGRVPVNVIGEVKKGDMLVTSAVPGYAIVDNDPKVGSVIGKAIEDKASADKGVVETLVGK